ncbi:MAG: hypothetical protein ACFFFH_20535, partial [Candidatus Thorarchaeota archaeon]
EIKKFENSMLMNLTTEHGYIVNKDLSNLNTQFKKYYHQLSEINMDLPEQNDFKPFIKEIFPKTIKEFLLFLEEKTKEIQYRFHSLKVRKNELNYKLLIFEKYGDIIEKLKLLVKELSRHSSKDYNVFFIDRSNFGLDTIISKIRESSSDEVEIYEKVIDDRITALIILKEDLSNIYDYFKQESIGSPIEEPEEYKDVSVNKTVVEIHESSDTIKLELTSLYDQLDSLAKEYKGLLMGIIPELEKKIRITEKIIGNIYISNFVFFITGILLTSDIETFRLQVKEEFESKITMNIEPISPAVKSS